MGRWDRYRWLSWGYKGVVGGMQGSAWRDGGCGMPLSCMFESFVRVMKEILSSRGWSREEQHCSYYPPRAGDYVMERL